VNVQTLRLKDHTFGNWHSEVLDRWEYRDFKRDEHWRTKWISFDCCTYVAATDRIYLGITSFDSDIFKAYDCAAGKFVDCGFGAVRDPFDAKFHRSLVQWDRNGGLYAAIALLHDVDKYWDAPGGAIVKHDPATGETEKLGIPMPHVYIQSICLDSERGMLYGQTFTPERMFTFDLNTHETRDLGPISSGMGMAQGENVELDSEGCAWCGWSVTRAWQSHSGPDSHRLCKYDPRTGKIHFYDAGLPRPDGSYGYMKVEGLFNLGPDRLYASGGNGALYRVDPETGMGTYIGTPIDDRPSRLASLRLGPDGAAYGVTGRDGQCEVIRFDPTSDTWELRGAVRQGDDACWQVHDVAITPDGTLFACENDNPVRSGYLWKLTLT